MSAPAASTSPSPEKARPARAPRKRGGRTLRASASLLAQGEAMVWLTGGALIVCLALIVGLLLIVLAFGLSTFWPSGLVRIKTVENNVYLGELTRTESYTLTQHALENLSGANAQAARAWLGDETQAVAHRSLLRIGNYEFTNNHFQWVTDYEIAPDGETFPEWAVLVERLEWGRFLGEPQEFVLHHVRTQDEPEKQLAETIQLFDANLSRLAPKQQEELTPELAKLRAEYAALKEKSSAALIQQLQGKSEQALWAVLENGEKVTLDKLPAGQAVAEVLEVWSDPEAIWTQYEANHGHARRQHARKDHLAKHEIGKINALSNDARLAVRREELKTELVLEQPAERVASLRGQIAAAEAPLAAAEKTAARVAQRFAGTPLAQAGQEIVVALRKDSQEQLAATQAELAQAEQELAEAPESTQQVLESYFETQAAGAEQTAQIREEMAEVERDLKRRELRLRMTWGKEQDASNPNLQKSLALGEIVRAYPANRLSFGQRVGIYLSRWGEFLLSDPREANSEGGVFPAIFGTVAMTLIMSLAVVPFGVLAALYLREYAKAGIVVSAVRIAINNLAGVPSVVFGVFGMGFFCYLMGAYVDGGPKNAGLKVWSNGSWWTLVLVTLITFAAAVGCTLWGRSARRGETTIVQRWARRGAWITWLAGFTLLLFVLAHTPYFEGFYRANLPNPTFGKGALIWASLTLALLTLPVVIVATEEALAAVPNSLREGSYACGGSKWQTIWRIVLPHALPGIMTGMILAMARGAGEVAPLMLVGAVKLAPELPFAVSPPFGLNRSFMHLGFHIYDLGFQSPNSEAAKPMVFTTTLLLIAIVFLMNISAVWLRNRLRRRYQTGQF